MIGISVFNTAQTTNQIENAREGGKKEQEEGYYFEIE